MQTIYLQRITTLVLFILLLFTISCSTPLRKVTYLNGIETGITYPESPLPDDYRIRPNDQLYVRVISDNPANAAFVNLQSETSGSLGSTQSMELITYLVDEEGYILYPFIGKLEVGNKTLSEVQSILQQNVNQYLENASVFVKLVNRTLTVLGSVSRPGLVSMSKTRLTVFEALGMAGDVTDYGNRQNVKIIREMPAGKHVAEINLTDPAIIASPYYYVLPRDIIYVESSTKVYGAKNMPYAAPITITASIISIGLLILNLIK